MENASQLRRQLLVLHLVVLALIDRHRPTRTSAAPRQRLKALTDKDLARIGISVDENSLKELLSEADKFFPPDVFSKPYS